MTSKVNDQDLEHICETKRNLVKRLRLSWFNRNCSSDELINYQGI